MAGTQQTTGLDELMAMLRKLDEDTTKVAKRALYIGAGVMADAYTNAVQSIRVGARRYHKEHGGRLPTQAEKDSLKIGIAKFREDGGGDEVNTIVGVPNGYTTVDGRQKATKMIARSINTGTSFMKKQPVFRKARSQSTRAAQEAIVAEAERLIDEITK